MGGKRHDRRRRHTPHRREKTPHRCDRQGVRELQGCQSLSGSSRLAEQLQHVLGLLVRQRQRRDTGRREDLCPRQLARLSGEVRIANLRVARRQVLETCLEASRVGFEHVSGEGAKPSAEFTDLIDRTLQDAAGRGEVPPVERGQNVVALPTLEAREERELPVDERATQAC